MRRFDGKVAVVTGASRGIGLAIAQRLVAEGAQVVITARGQESLDAAVATLGGAEVAVGIAGKGDDDEHRAAVIAATVERFGSVDLLVNNVGINPTYGPVLSIDPGVARKVVEVNVLGAIGWTRHAVEAGLRDNGGAILNVASVAGIRPAPGIGFYGSTKAMVIHLTEELAVELAPQVRVNAIAPAVVKTKFAEALYVGREAEAAADYPLARLGEPDDIAGPAAFLLSDDAAWITGQTLVIDGGLSLGGGL